MLYQTERLYLSPALFIQRKFNHRDIEILIQNLCVLRVSVVHLERVNMELPIEVGISPALGIRGILAARAIRRGEVIERCPVILIDNRQAHAVEQTIFRKYWYDWNKHFSCVVLGYGGLYNHSFQPNVKYHHDYRNRRLVYSALRDIQQGEELVINYNGEPDDYSEIDPHYLDAADHG